MSDEQGEDALPQPHSAPAAPHRGRGRVALIAVAVLVVIGVAAALSGGEPEAPPSAGDPVATLDAALAAGEPVYVLIHSLT